ncbi:MAG: neutral ceramidase [Verrucomicrobiales bacterium]|jgi:neutral ceramidase
MRATTVTLTIPQWLCLLMIGILLIAAPLVAGDGVRIGAVAVNLKAADNMEIAGGIHPGSALGQEGELRAIAIVLEKDGVKLAIVTLDILMITRDILDPTVKEIEAATGIPGTNILINCTHTHHAPSTMRVHGYGADLGFTLRVKKAIVEAVKRAHAKLSKDECDFHFHLGREATVGQNSRQLLPDGRIYWIGRREFVRPTGPFDPELPVLAFRARAQGKLQAVLFNHSTHTIGTVKPGVRSPSFYGLAGQRLEAELGGVFSFVEGASGSTHNLYVSGADAIDRIAGAVREALTKAERRPVTRLASRKRPFKYKVRTFDEEAEQAEVSTYCSKWVGDSASSIVPVFEEMRRQLAPVQGEERETWVQAMVIGDVAIVGVPAEFFTKLGVDIKNRSPYRYTYVAELANDWIGYLPDKDAHKLGGYQVWTGFHSYTEPGTGERVVNEAIALLDELKAAE